MIEELPRYNKGYDIIQGIKVENTRLSQRRNSENKIFLQGKFSKSFVKQIRVEF